MVLWFLGTVFLKYISYSSSNLYMTGFFDKIFNIIYQKTCLILPTTVLNIYHPNKDSIYIRKIHLGDDSTLKWLNETFLLRPQKKNLSTISIYKTNWNPSLVSVNSIYKHMSGAYHLSLLLNIIWKHERSKTVYRWKKI